MLLGDELGVNIWINEYVPTAEVDKQAEWWDTNRFVGDSDLAHDDELEWEYFDRDGDGQTTYRRPKDWTAFETWVDENVPEGANRDRWMEAITKLKADETLWMEFCW